MHSHTNQTLVIMTLCILLYYIGNTHIAIYGLGAVRDERLNRLWSSNNVKFIRPTNTTNNTNSDTTSNGNGNSNIKYFNIFVLHQNRDYGRG